MKKVIILITLTLLITGCSNNKKLECTKEVKEDNLTVINQVTLKQKNESITDGTMKITVNIPEEYIDIKEHLFESLKDMYKHLEGKEGVTVLFIPEETANKVEIVAEVKLLENTLIEEIFKLPFDSKTELEVIKEGYQNSGYTCK